MICPISLFKANFHSLSKFAKGEFKHRLIFETSGIIVFGFEITTKTHFIGCECGKVFFGKASESNPFINTK